MFIITDLTFCKPCFVPSYCKRQMPRTQVVIIYLQNSLSFSPFGSFEKFPTKFGFLARGVYRVPLSPFLVRLRHCGTFKDTLPYPKKDVGIFPAVSLSQAALAYFFARHEHYGHLSTVRAWTFLCNALNSITAITRTLINNRYYKRQ